MYIRSLVKSFEYFLRDKEFTLKTDHANLVLMEKSKETIIKVKVNFFADDSEKVEDFDKMMEDLISDEHFASTVLNVVKDA